MPVYEITSPDGRVFEVTAPDGASHAEVLAYAQKNYQPKQVEPTAPTKPKTFLDSVGDAAAGAVRGAGSIGATLLAPVDMATDFIKGDRKGLGPLSRLVVGNDYKPPMSRNEERRADMTGALGMMGADTDSTAFAAGKLGGEIAGTAGIGGALAKPVQMLANTRMASGIEPLIDGLARSLQTGGMRVGPLAGTSAAMPARVIGGAATGGAAAGMVNPEDAGAGALIGGALPMGIAAAGKAGTAVGSAMRRGAAPNAEKLQTARNAMNAGYIIPPSQVDPTFKNRMIESLSGKFETAQMASTANQSLTDDLARAELGISRNTPFNQAALQQVRKQAGQVYQQLKGTGMVTADNAYTAALDDITKSIKSATASFPQLGKTNMHGQPVDEIGDMVSALKVGQFDAGGAVDAIAVLRDNADGAFRAGNNAMGRANKAAAKALEDVLERHLQRIGATDLLPAYRDARKTIAQTYSVEKGLREGAGTMDARVLGRELQKGKPLTGNLRLIAEFGNTFDKAAQPPHLIGSPAVSALKPMFSVLTGTAGAGAMGPAGALVGATNYVLPPVARSLMFSKPFQRGLLAQSAPLLDESAQLGLLSQSLYRGLPILPAQ